MDTSRRIPQLFLCLSGLAFFSCISRSDYNLPLFLFAWFMWQDHQKVKSSQIPRVRILYLIVSTIFIDIIWILYWSSAWNHSNGNSWIDIMNHIVFVVSIIEVTLKIGTTILVLISEKQNLIENLPEALGNILQKI
jgi:hypothetical protein